MRRPGSRSTGRLLRRLIRVFLASLAVALPSLTAAPVPALAAPATFSGYQYLTTYYWTPTSATVNVGEMVTWQNAAGSHGLAELGTGWPASCPNGGLGSCAFTTPGTYNFQCAMHGALMKGTLTVVGSAPPPPPPPPPTQPPAAPPPVPAPAPTHSAAAPGSTPPPAAATQAGAPSPSPSDTSQALAEPPSPTPGHGILATTNASSSGGLPGGWPLLILGLIVVGGAVAGAVYFVGIRKPDRLVP